VEIGNEGELFYRELLKAFKIYKRTIVIIIKKALTL